uniref:(California timema) hypothetical protein n=1 Tax=Timema californicum TaxID=61474 RepID=A0A7R9J012_TIMCA|nr:unnamed protein product [Timema californicum]
MSSVMSASFESVSTASLLSVPLDFISVIFSGIFIQLGNLPPHLSWIRYTSTFYFGIEAISILQWEQILHIQCPDDPEIPCISSGIGYASSAALHQVQDDTYLNQNGMGRSRIGNWPIPFCLSIAGCEAIPRSRSPSSRTPLNSQIPPTLHREGHSSPSTLATSLPFSGLREMTAATLTSKSLREKMTPAHMELSTSGDTKIESDTDGQGTFTLASKLTRTRKFKAEQKQT